MGFFAKIAAWFTERLHFKKTELKGLEEKVHVPVGTLSEEANAGVETGTVVALAAAEQALKK